MPATVSVLSMTGTSSPKMLSSDMPSYCGIDTKDRLSLGHLKYEHALKMSEGCKLHEHDVVL